MKNYFSNKVRFNTGGETPPNKKKIKLTFSGVEVPGIGAKETPESTGSQGLTTTPGETSPGTTTSGTTSSKSVVTRTNTGTGNRPKPNTSQTEGESVEGQTKEGETESRRRQPMNLPFAPTPGIKMPGGEFEMEMDLRPRYMNYGMRGNVLGWGDEHGNFENVEMTPEMREVLQEIQAKQLQSSHNAKEAQNVLKDLPEWMAEENEWRRERGEPPISRQEAIQEMMTKYGVTSLRDTGQLRLTDEEKQNILKKLNAGLTNIQQQGNKRDVLMEYQHGTNNNMQREGGSRRQLLGWSDKNASVAASNLLEVILNAAKQGNIYSESAIDNSQGFGLSSSQYSGEDKNNLQTERQVQTRGANFRKQGGKITFKQGGKILSNLITHYVNKRKV